MGLGCFCSIRPDSLEGGARLEFEGITLKGIARSIDLLVHELAWVYPQILGHALLLLQPFMNTVCRSHLHDLRHTLHVPELKVAKIRSLCLIP